MASRDGLTKTEKTGVFYREHPNRKDGVRKDRQWVIRQTQGGVTRISTFGWSSLAKKQSTDDAKNPEANQDNITYSVKSYGDACNKADEYRENFKWNKANPDQLQRQICKADEDSSAVEKELLVLQRHAEEIHQNTTFSQFFEEIYFPQAKLDKAKGSWGAEDRLYRLWIKPVIGELTFPEISIEYLNKLKANMTAGKRNKTKKHPRDKKKSAKGAQERRTPARPMSPRSINYAMATIRQAWNLACAVKPPLAFGAWPGAVKAFKKPKVDNQRKRFLTKNEAATLLAALKLKSKDLHDMALLSLHCGLRAGDIFKLTWNKVNLTKGELLLVDTKNSESRISYLTDQSKEMLRQRSLNCQHRRIVFVSGTGEQYTQVPVTFSRTVKELGLNEGATDSRDKIVFHSLRHTYASWLVEHGASLPIVRDLLGHKNLIMTSRYSHVSADAQKSAVEALNQAMKPTGENVIDLQEKRKSTEQ